MYHAPNLPLGFIYLVWASFVRPVVENSLQLLPLTAFLQAVKAIDFVGYIAASDDTLALCKKWILFDVAYCLALTRLRIPRLNYSRTVVLLQLLLVVIFDGLMFGGISLNVGGRIRDAGFSSYSGAFSNARSVILLLPKGRRYPSHSGTFQCIRRSWSPYLRSPGL